MSRIIHRLEDALKICDPIRKELNQCIRKGFEDWLLIREFANSLEQGMVEYHARTKANIIHEHIRKYIISGLKDKPEIKIDTFNGVFGLIIANELFIRFKKMDSGYDIRNIPTKQHLEFKAQGNIQGFPEHPTFLFAGYIPDLTWSKITGIYLACWINDTLEWVDDVGRLSLEQGILPLDATESEIHSEIEKRIQLKNKKNKKTGSGD